MIPASSALRPASFPVQSLRAQFPALQHAGSFVFFDNGGGAQIPQAVFDAVNRHLLGHNVQRGGRYPQSIRVDQGIEHARRSVAAFINAPRPEEIAFGMNATSFVRLISLAIGQTLGDRNEIIVTDLDHEANIASWLALERCGARFRWWRAREDAELHLEDLRPLLSQHTRLLACAPASNALGGLLDVRAAADLVHAAGGEIFLDAVHYGPHAPLDVQAFDCDYLVCSGYKIFAPHMGFLWGRYSLLAQLPTFREDFIPDAPPGKIEAGTFMYENVAGMAAAIDYLAALGRQYAESPGKNISLPQLLHTAMRAIQSYEQLLAAELLQVLRSCDAVVYGIADPRRVAERVPTVCFNLAGVAPHTVTEAAAAAGIAVRDGHMYSPRLMKRLQLSVDSGAVRVSMVHYNTVEEIARLKEVLERLRGR